MCPGGCSDTSVGPVDLTGKKVQLTLADNSALVAVGGSVRNTFTEDNGGKLVIVVRTAANKFQTMSTTCTHEGEIIGNPNGNKAICPRHGAQFSAAEGNFGAKSADKAQARFKRSQQRLTLLMASSKFHFELPNPNAAASRRKRRHFIFADLGGMEGKFIESHTPLRPVRVHFPCRRAERATHHGHHRKFRRNALFVR